MEQALSVETTIVAWWGAVLATIVFLWDIYKWLTSGARLRLTATPDRIIVNDPEREGITYISFEAENIGNQATTVRSLHLRSYANLFCKIIRRPNKAAYIQPDAVYRLPYVLEPGRVWEAFFIQTDEIEEWARSECLYCELAHSHNKRSQAVRLKINIKKSE